LDWRDLDVTPPPKWDAYNYQPSAWRQRPRPAVAPEMLPLRYRNGQPVCAAPMGSAPMRYAEDGQVAWDRMWTDFCDLALAGGPPHRDTVLEPAPPEEVLAAPDNYRRVVAEIERGLHLVTGLPTVRSGYPGWVGLRCGEAAMARRLVCAIEVENVAVRYLRRLPD
jgi:sirohydrochlorin cobaltochelatase